jgi:hypothetical protein
VTWSGSARQASECPSWPGWPPRRRGERFLAFLARLARAAGPSEPGGIEEFDESIPTRRFSCSISASNAAITASRSARAASNSSRLSSPGSGTHPNYGSRRIPAITTETGASTSSPTQATGLNGYGPGCGAAGLADLLTAASRAGCGCGCRPGPWPPRWPVRRCAGDFAGVRGDGEQAGSLAAGAGRGEQPGGHGREPAEPHDAAAPPGRRPAAGAAAGIPPGHADHDPGDGAGGSVPSVQGQDQPGQLRSRVGRPGNQPPSSSVRAQRSGCRRSRGLRAASGRSPSGW